MEVTSKEQKRAEQLLQSQHIGLHQIKSFSFMKRYHQVPRKSNLAAKDKYGPGILTLHLKEGKEKVIYLPPFRHPSSVIRYLVSQEIPFDNYAPRERTVAEVPTETYQRPSLYMFWFFVLFLIFLILGYYSISGRGFIPAIISFALSLFFISSPDGVVLGCTHYVFLKKFIKEFYDCPVFDGNEGIKHRLSTVLSENFSRCEHSRPPETTFRGFFPPVTTFVPEKEKNICFGLPGSTHDSELFVCYEFHSLYF